MFSHTLVYLQKPALCSVSIPLAEILERCQVNAAALVEDMLKMLIAELKVLRYKLLLADYL